jgi:hypothetical protein
MQAPPINVHQSRWDQATYYGRLRHFIEVTSPLTLFYSSAKLEEAQRLLVDYSHGKRPDLYGQPETVWKAKQRESALALSISSADLESVVDSSIHPGRSVPGVPCRR